MWAHIDKVLLAEGVQEICKGIDEYLLHRNSCAGIYDGPRREVWYKGNKENLDVEKVFWKFINLKLVPYGYWAIQTGILPIPENMKITEIIDALHNE